VPREESHKPDMQLSVKKLYLGGVKEPLTEDDLKEYFGKYGTVAEAIVMKDREGQYRG
jgi:RNA-binding protein Musashi